MKVKYIGGKPKKRDNITGSDFVWTPEQVHDVPDEVGKRLVGFPSVWVEQRNKPGPKPKSSKTTLYPVPDSADVNEKVEADMPVPDAE